MEQGNRVLLIAYYFPPCGMGGVQRAAKMAKFLPGFGWDVSVLTVKDIAYYERDISLLDELSSVDIQRTGSLDPLRIAHLVSSNKRDNGRNLKTGAFVRICRFIERLFFVPDSKILWIPFAFIKSLKICRNKKYDAVISTGPPFSSHLLGFLISKTSGLPWIADFRDGWTNNDFLPLKSSPIRYLNLKLERFVLRKANKVSGISNTIVEHLKTLAVVDPEKVSLVYNGFDEEDFCAGTVTPANFTLVMVGTVTKWADVSVFLPAINLSGEEDPSFLQDVSIKIIGKILHKSFLNTVNQSPLKDRIVLKGYMPHKEAVAEMMGGNLLLFPITNTESSGIVTGKIFEYIASGIPILAYAPDGEARNLLENHCDQVFFHSDDAIAETTDYILQQYSKWKKRDKPLQGSTTNWKMNRELQQFSRKEQARLIAGLLDSAVS